MPKATTKAELVEAANQTFEKMWKIISLLSQNEKEQNFLYDKHELTAKDNAAHWSRDNNLRDILTHLYEWHTLLLNWVESNINGIQKPFLPTPYTWASYQQMNVGFFKKHQNTTYNQAEHLVKESHQNVVELIEKFSQLQLFEKKHLTWTGTTSLAQYFHSATVAHYDWAIKKLKAYQKALKK